MLIKNDQSCLVLIDVQEKLFPFVRESDELASNCKWMLELAHLLEIPTLVTEQYPKGLGGTIEELKPFVKESPFHKTAFSIVGDEAIKSHIDNMPHSHYCLIGIETHVCVLQSALGLREMGKEVFVITDCVSGRGAHDRAVAFDRMQAAGVTLVTKEMVLFEWVRNSKHEHFKEISQNFLK